MREGRLLCSAGVPFQEQGKKISPNAGDENWIKPADLSAGTMQAVKKYPRTQGTKTLRTRSPMFLLITGVKKYPRTQGTKTPFCQSYTFLTPPSGKKISPNAGDENMLVLSMHTFPLSV